MAGRGGLGFADDAPRDATDQFVKVEVGKLLKPESGTFRLGQRWPVVELAKSTLVDQKPDQATVEQVLPGSLWSYRQTKTYEVSAEGELTPHPPLILLLLL